MASTKLKTISSSVKEVEYIFASQKDKELHYTVESYKA